MKALKFENGHNTANSAGWSVAVQANDGRIYWIDVQLNKTYSDVECDWNQYIFYHTDKEDMARAAFQEDVDNFDEATSVAIGYLQSKGILLQDAEGNWKLGGSANV